MGAVSNLSLADNLVLKMLNDPERSDVVWGSDLGYNKIQQLTDLMNKKAGGSKRVYQQKFEMYKLGSLEITQAIGAAATTSGAASGNIIVTLAQPNNNFRERDIIADTNMVQGKIERVLSATQFELSPSTTTWNTSLHFTNGSYAKVLYDASPNRGSRGKSSLTVTPDSDFNYTGVSRESNHMYIADGIKTYPKYKGKYWYTSHQTMTLQRFAKNEEKRSLFSERRILNAGTPQETYTTGALRWNIINNGGTYLPLTGKITRDEWHDFLNSMMQKTTNNGRRIVALMGQQFMSDLQDLNRDAITYAGNQSTFGGLSVKGFDTRMYASAGMEVEFDRYPLFDDPEFFPEISNITGKRRWSTSCLLLDLTPIESADGTGEMVAPIQKRHFGSVETRMKYLPGMMSLEEMNDDRAAEVMKSGDFSLAVSDLDACQFELYRNSGWYIIPKKLGLIELID
jgi:hypothetical protein